MCHSARRPVRLFRELILIDRPHTAPRLRALWLLCFAAVLLCMPALLNRSPFVYPDTRGYYVGGAIAIDKISSVVDRVFSTQPAADSASAEGQETVRQARGVRSAFYSMFVYVLGGSVSLWFVIAAQALATAWACLVAHRTLTGEAASANTEDTGYLPIMVLLAVATGASWSVSLLMPDAFAAVLILAVATLVVYWRRCGPVARLLLAAAVSFAVLVHASHLPLAVATIVVGALIYRQEVWQHPARWIALVVAVAVTIPAMLAVSIVGFKQVTLFPQRPPFMLARSIQDGPAKLYLEARCPAIGLEMCNHLDRLNTTADNFLWAPDGLYSAVSPDARDRIRAEEGSIIKGAARDYPVLWATAVARNLVQQLTGFGLIDYTLGSHASVTPTEMDSTMPDTPVPPWKTAIEVLHYVVVVASIAVLLWLWVSGRMSGGQRRFALIVIASIIINAGVCGALSSPSYRYQTRVIWLLPFMAATLALNQLRVPLRAVAFAQPVRAKDGRI